MQRSQAVATAERFSSFMKRSGVDPLDVFREFDRGKSGLLKPDHFQRALASARFYYTPQEFDSLLEEYGTNGVISYRRFCEDIGPQGFVTLSRTSTFDTVDQTALAKFGVSLKQKGLTLYDIMKEYDRMHLGHVNVTVFLQAVGYSRVIESLIKPYMTGTEVNYMAIQRDIDELDKTTGMTVTTMKGPLPPFFYEFARAVNSKRVNMREVLMEHDYLDRSVKLTKHDPNSTNGRVAMMPTGRPNPSGNRVKRSFIPIDQCLAALASLRLPFSPRQLQEICAPFLSDDGVDVNSFCNAFDGEIAVVTQDTSRWTQSFDNKPTDIDIVLDDIRKQITQRHLRLSEVFEDELVRLRGQMTRADFYRILSRMGFVFSEPDSMALDNSFMLRDGLMDGRGFADAVDPPQIKTEYRIDTTLESLSEFLTKRRIELPPLFIAYDRLQSGQVTLAQFVAIMRRVGFEIPDQDLRQWAKTYGNGQTFNWKRLCLDINQDAPVTPRVQEMPPPPCSSAEPSADLAMLMREINATAKRTKTNLMAECMRFDNLKTGVITRRRFKDVIESLPLRIRVERLAELVDFYADPGHDGVHYRPFIEDLSKNDQPPPRETLPFRRTLDPDGVINDSDTQRQALSVWTVPEFILPTLRHFRAAANCKRIDIEELFYASDNSRTGYIDCDSLKSIMQPLDRLLPEKVYDDIIQVFRDRRMPEKFNYKRFCAAFYAAQPTQQDIDEVTSLANELSHINVALTLSNDIRARLETRRVNINVFFRHLRTPTIPERDFMRILDSLPLVLNDREKTMLCRHNMSEEEGEVDWKKFVSEVESSKPYLCR